jgi:hypothetical protein
MLDYGKMPSSSILLLLLFLAKFSAGDEIIDYTGRSVDDTPCDAFQNSSSQLGEH